MISDSSDARAMFRGKGTPTKRRPPYSEEEERVVLGSVLLDFGRVFDLCIERQIEEDSFYFPAHKIVFAAMFEMHKRGAAIDQVTLREELRGHTRFEEMGGPSIIEGLVDATPSVAYAEHYIDRVRQLHLLRLILNQAEATATACYESDENADALLSRVEQAFLDITEHQHGVMTLWSDAVKQSIRQADNFIKSHKGLNGISTGFVSLDQRLLGLRNSEMIVLAARPSMGKTSLAMNIVENLALGHGGDGVPKPVGVFSLEMSMDALVLRMLCSHARVSSHRLLGGYADSTNDWRALTYSATTLQRANIYLDDTGGLDVMELRARARRMKKKHGVCLIMVDYLQLLHSRDYSKQGRQLETSHISANLKAMAKELKVPVLVLSQLSRAPEQRDKSGKPRLSDLRDSGAIEQDADVVLMLRRPCRGDNERDPDHADRRLAIVDVAKHRNGPVGEVRMNFDEDYTRFEDRVEGVDEVLDAQPIGALDAAEVEQ